MKQYIVGGVVLIAIVAVGAYVSMADDRTEDVVRDEVADSAMADGSVMDSDGGVMMEGDEMMVEGAVYTIQSESSVSYVAQKEFFSKPTAEIVGVAQDVSGVIVYDEDEGTVAATASIVPTFKSDSDMRDGDMQERFTENITVTVDQTPVDVSRLAEGPVDVTVPVTLSINGVSQQVSLDAQITLAGDTVTVSGSSTINLNDFSFDPPSALNIYTVNEMLGLRFNIVAQAI